MSDNHSPLPPPPFWRTWYFAMCVMAKRPIDPVIVMGVLSQPYRRIRQPDGRIQHWAWVHELNCWYRVVTLDDGETVHNAFPDRDFEP